MAVPAVPAVEQLTQGMEVPAVPLVAMVVLVMQAGQLFQVQLMKEVVVVVVRAAPDQMRLTFQVRVAMAVLVALELLAQ
jgi:hypothetical protein